MRFEFLSSRIRDLGSSMVARVPRAARWDGAWILPVSAFLVSLWRAVTLSISHDEALTVLRYVPLGYGAILGLGPLSLSFANNHPLNTLSMKVLVQAFGLHLITSLDTPIMGDTDDSANAIMRLVSRRADPSAWRVPPPPMVSLVSGGVTVVLAHWAFEVSHPNVDA